MFDIFAFFGEMWYALGGVGLIVLYIQKRFKKEERIMTTERILLLVCHTALIIFGIIFLLIFILLKVTDKIQSFKDYLVAFVTLLGAPLILCSFYLIPISEELKTGIVIGILFMGLPLALSICYLIGKVIDARKIQARYENLI